METEMKLIKNWESRQGHRVNRDDNSRQREKRANKGPTAANLIKEVKDNQRGQNMKSKGKR